MARLGWTLGASRATSIFMTTVLLDGSLLLTPDQTGIASYTRTLAAALHTMGVDVDLLLGKRAHAHKNAPPITLGLQVFGNEPNRWGKLRSASRLWRARFGFRRQLTAQPVPIEGIDLRSYTPRLPPYRALYNADDYPTHASAVFALRGAMTRIILQHQVDAVHWTVPAPVHVRRALNIFTLHDLIPMKFPHFTIDVAGRSASLHTMIARHADHIVTVSERSREDIKAMLGVSDERISVTYQSVPSLHPGPREDAERLVRNMYRATADGYVFFCGAIEPKKNLLRLIEAFSLADTGKELLLAGPLGWLYDDVLPLLTDKTRSRPVRYLGYLPRHHIIALMQCASFFAFPSIYEGFGLPVLEAMALGVPVLTSHGGSLPEVAGDAAVLVDPLDVTEMTQAIRTLAADAGLRQALAIKGYSQAAKFSPSLHMERLSAAYRKVGISLPSAAVMPTLTHS
jgi:glycosyltransferase involved in cell wall biosynthesis